MMATMGVNMWSPQWFEKSITDMDMHRFVDSLKKAGAQALYLWQGFTQDHFGVSYFDSSFTPVHRNLEPGRDHAQEILDACRQEGIRVIGYYSFPDAAVYAENPDWRQRDHEGNDISPEHFWYRRFGGLCPNSPYREYLVARVMEIVDRYDFDGMYLPDSMHFMDSPLGCYCPYCRRKYREQFGADMPVPRKNRCDPEWLRFLAWRSDSVREVFAEIARLIRTRRPGMLITHFAFFNWSCNLDFETMIDQDDMVCDIPGWSGSPDGESVSRDVNQIWRVGKSAVWLKGITCGKPVNIHFGRFPYDREYQTIPEHEMRLGIFSIAMNGGTPSIADNLFPDGRPNGVAYDRIAKVHAELKSKAGLFSGYRKSETVGLYYSHKSLTYSDSVWPGENRYLDGFDGAYLALMKSHVPFGILGARNVSAERLGAFKAIILPETIVMGQDEIAAFTDYVARGGKLVICGKSSLCDAGGIARADFGLSGPMGVHYEGIFNYRKSYVSVQDAEFGAGWDTRECLLVRDPQVRVCSTGDAVIHGTIVAPATEICAPQRTMTYAGDVSPWFETQFPAIVTHGYGEGSVVWFSFDVCRTYGVFGYPSARHLLENAIHSLLGNDSIVTTNAQENIAMTLFEREGQSVVHLLNQNCDGALRLHSGKGGSFGVAPVPAGSFSVTIKAPSGRDGTAERIGHSSGMPVSVRNSGGEDLPCRIGPEGLTVDIPAGLLAHEAIRIEW